MRKTVIVLLLTLVAGVLADDSTTFEDSSTRIALKLYHECAKDDGLSVCLKKKAVTLLDRLARADNITLVDGITLYHVGKDIKKEPEVTEQQLEQILPRSIDDKEDVLTNMIFEKFCDFVGSRTVEIALPKITAEDFVGEARKGSGGGGLGGGGGKGGGGKKGGKKGGMMNMAMGILGAKMAALMALKTVAALFIAKKALIIGKIALSLALVMLFRKMMKGNGGGHDHHDHHVVHSSGWDSGSSGGGYSGGGYSDSHGSGGGWQSGGGGWQSGGGSGGGWGKRALDAQDLAYNAYNPKQ